MKMIWHENELMQEISFPAMQKERFEEQSRPRFSAEQCASFPRVGRDEIRLRVVCRMLASGFQNNPSAAKAAAFFSSQRHG
jgi:hypothetical protein